MSQVAEKDYWEDRFDQLFPNGLTQQETDEANAVMRNREYPTREMADEAPEPILIVKQGK